jgi:hypothetical protein
MLDGKPVWVFKRSEQPDAGIRIAGADGLTPGRHTLSLDFAVRRTKRIRFSRVIPPAR